MQTELVTLRAADGTPLDGVRYTREGDGRPPSARAVVNFLHGRSMSFYVGLPRFAGPELVAAGYDVLAMNRRSAGVANIRDSFQGVGDAWTRWAEHRMDVEAAVTSLRGLGHRRIALVGHSQGGLLAAHFAAADQDVAGLILASPVFVNRGLPSAFPEERRAEMLERAKGMVSQGRGKDLILLPQWPWIISADAVADAQAPGSGISLDEVLSRVDIPLLVFCGDRGHDTAVLGRARKALQRSASRQKHLEVLEGCDHFYVGYEDRVVGLMKEWLATYVPPA